MKSKSFIKLFTLNLKVVHIIIVWLKLTWPPKLFSIFMIIRIDKEIEIYKMWLVSFVFPSFQASLFSTNQGRGCCWKTSSSVVVQFLAARNTTHLPLISCSLSKLQVTTAVGQYPRDHVWAKNLKDSEPGGWAWTTRVLGGCGEGILAGWGRAASLDQNAP